MPQLENSELIGTIVRAATFVLSRRTSETFANLVIDNVIKELSEKYSFLKNVKIKGTKYSELSENLVIDSDIKDIESKEVGKATKEFIEKIISVVGKDAGYYFIKEIKEDLPAEYEQSIKEYNIDFDFLQSQFITNVKVSSKASIKNSDVLGYTIRVVFDVLDKELGKNISYKTICELVERLNTVYDVFKHVTINDIRVMQGVNIVSIDPQVDSMDPINVGNSIQKIVQELHDQLGERTAYSFITKFKNYFNNEYLFILEEMGVNLDIIELKIEAVIKNVLNTLVNVISDSSKPEDSLMFVDSALRKFENKYSCLKHIKIDNKLFLEGKDGIVISSEIESEKGYEIGRAIQSVIEDIADSLGKDIGLVFIQNFRRRLGKALTLRIEKLGVNLHMLELKQSLIWI